MGVISDYGQGTTIEPPAPAATAPTASVAARKGGLDQFMDSEARDIADAGANQGGAAAAGRAARATLETPLVAAASALPDLRDMGSSVTRAARTAGGAISSFARGFTGAPAASAQAPAAAATPASASGTITGSSGVSSSSSGPVFGDPGHEDISPELQAQLNAMGIHPGGGGGGGTKTTSQDYEQARPSNVRAYLRVPANDNATPAAPTVDPEAFARQVVAMGNVDPSASIGNAVDASVNARAYAKSYLAALAAAQSGYTGQTGRITALANQQLSSARTGQTQAQTGETEASTLLKRYSLEQQQNLQALTQKLQDPNLSSQDRRNLEMQLWILHGKPPRPDNRFQAVQGKTDLLTGQQSPGFVIDRGTGEVKSLDVPGAPAKAASDPLADARAAVAAGAPKDKVNERLKQMGLATID